MEEELIKNTISYFWGEKWVDVEHECQKVTEDNKVV
jgi:hypothetical protein